MGVHLSTRMRNKGEAHHAVPSEPETIIAALLSITMALPSASRRRHLTAAAHRARLSERARRPVPASAQRWMWADGSLTARLRGLGEVKVTRLRQGPQALHALEQRLLGVSHGHVREVLLWVDERPAVWARSVVCARGVQGAWRALRGLGNRPLAELLFADRLVRRTPLQAGRPTAHGLQASHLLRGWPQGKGFGLAPAWWRWSVFTRRGQALLVQEALAPWVLRRTPPNTRR